MLDELNPAECLAKVNTTFLVGDVRTTLTGCDALASVHIGSYLNGNEMANMTMSYFSHSIEEFLFNIKNLPDIFANGTATHQCLIPKIQFTTHEDTQYPTIYTSPGLFTDRTRPGQVIANATEKFFYWNNYDFYVGEPISAGLTECTTVRYDWKLGDKIQNQTYDVHYPGNTTKQLLKLDGSQSITNPSIACVDRFQGIGPSNQNDFPSGSMAYSSRSLVQFVALSLAALVAFF